MVKPHGIRGEVVVHLLTDRVERFAPGAVVAADARELVVESSRPHRGGLLVKFAQVADRTAAERMRGVELAAPPLDDGAGETYLVSELVGMGVVDVDGRDLGTVRHVVELPAAAGYDLLEVGRADGSTWLLPAVEDYVRVEEDAAGGDVLVVVEPPEGLLG